MKKMTRLFSFFLACLMLVSLVQVTKVEAANGELAGEVKSDFAKAISDLQTTELMGGVMTDLQSRRAIVMGMDSEGMNSIIKAKVPLAEMYRYSTALSSLTSGRGTYTMSFAEYEAVPTDVQSKLLKAYEEQTKDEE